jgi:ATP-binding cassette, subfamily B, bacterial
MNTNKPTEYTFIQTFKFFYNSLGKRRVGFLLSVIGFGICSFLFFAASFQFARVIDYLTNKGAVNPSTLWWLLGSVVATYGLDKLVRAVSGFYLNRIKINSQIELRKEIFDRLSRFDLRWHQSKNSGAKVEKINSGIQGYTSLFNMFEWSIMWNLMNFIIPVIFFATLGWKYIVVFVLFGFLMFIVKALIQTRINNNNQKLEDIYEVSTNKFFEFSNNILTIKALNAVKVFKKAIFASDEAKRELQITNNKLETQENFVRNIGETILIDLALIFLLVNDYLAGNITLGTFQLAFTNSWSITWAIISLSRILFELNEAKIKISRLIPIFEETPNNFFGQDILNQNWDTIKINNLNFDYTINDVTTPALVDININLEKGKKYGFVGHSGSGKSTLTKLLVGLYQINSGQILFTGKEEQSFYSLSEKEISNNIAIVLQETELFDLTFRENLTLLKHWPEEDIMRVIKITQLDQVLEKLPSGLDTELGEKGYKLSGGEKQRLGIARALLTDAQIIIFDEATSALDSHTETLIQEAIEKELEDKTLILVAHRLSTLKNVDRIFVFSKGMVIEDGKFEQLINNPTTYFHKLWTNQTKKHLKK